MFTLKASTESPWIGGGQPNQLRQTFLCKFQFLSLRYRLSKQFLSEQLMTSALICPAYGIAWPFSLDLCSRMAMPSLPYDLPSNHFHRRVWFLQSRHRGRA